MGKVLEKYFGGGKCMVIAEVAQAHEGSLGMAHAFIDAVAEAGADAIKFQTHIADAESTPGEPWRVKFSLQDRTRFDYWKRMEFSPEGWAGLASHARERGLIFFSSPFSPEAVDLLEETGVPFWKVGSGEILCKPLIDRMAATGKPIFISTGMSTMEELDMCINWVKEAGIEYMVFQCTSQYPCPPERVGLNLLEYFRKRYSCPVGLSDHSGSIFPGIAAATLGASAVEVHITFSKKAFGPDAPASLTIEELATLVGGIRQINRMAAYPVDKELISREYGDLRSIFYKSLVARTGLSAGTVIEANMLACKKPGGGIPAYRLEDFVGRKLRSDVMANQQLREDDFTE